MFDRDTALKQAEKLLRQGRLDGAIAEYLKIVEDQPGDWASANTLGDLYGRAGRLDEAIAQYSRIAEQFMRDGFLPRAAAIYKKILKVRRDDDPAQLQLAEIAAKQGLLADARAHFAAVASRRRAREDRAGEAEIVIRLGSIDQADTAARLAAARTLAEMGETSEAAARYRALHADLTEQGRTEEALETLRHFVRLTPADLPARRTLARAALEAGDAAGVREFLDRETADGDAQLMLALARIELEAGEHDRFSDLLGPLLVADPSLWPLVLDMGRGLRETHPATAFASVSAAADAAVACSRPDEGVAALRAYLEGAPGDIPALQRLIEVCVDAGLERAMREAQVGLADAYLDCGFADEARVVAEDLIACEPWEAAHLDRYRRALSLLGEPDPDAVIALRLSGESPFTATDPFADADDLPALLAAPDPVRVTPPAPPVPAIQSPSNGAGTKPASAPDYGEVDLSGSLEPAHADASPRPVAGGAEERASVSPPAERVETASAASSHSAEHLSLGRNYLEIGMVQEGIAALKTAARSPQTRFQAAATLGRFYHRRGDLAQAIEWLEHAAEAAPSHTEEGREILYELGVALDSAGESARALAVFMELRSDGGEFRDVTSRLDRLAREQPGG